MAKVKGGKKHKAPLAAQEARHRAAHAEPSPFERLSNKKRFSVMGRKLKGETRQLGKLRSEASERVRLAACL